MRLMLWPIGALVGARPAMTPGRSWGLMRGQVAGFVGAAILLNLPPILATPAYVALLEGTRRHGPVGELTCSRSPPPSSARPSD